MYSMLQPCTGTHYSFAAPWRAWRPINSIIYLTDTGSHATRLRIGQRSSGCGICRHYSHLSGALHPPQVVPSHKTTLGRRNALGSYWKTLAYSGVMSCSNRMLMHSSTFSLNASLVRCLGVRQWRGAQFKTFEHPICLSMLIVKSTWFWTTWSIAPECHYLWVAGQLFWDTNPQQSLLLSIYALHCQWCPCPAMLPSPSPSWTDGLGQGRHQ